MGYVLCFSCTESTVLRALLGTCKLTIMPFRDAGYVPDGPDRFSLPQSDDVTWLTLAYLAGYMYGRCVHHGRAVWGMTGESGEKRSLNDG